MFRFIALLAALCCSSVAASTVSDIVSSNANLTTLTAVLKQADLLTVLDGAGPFTIFAPSNHAFSKVPAYKIKMVTSSENADVLTGLLKYHVSPASLNSSTFYATEKIATLQGSHVFIDFIDGTTILGMASATCEKDVRFEGTQIAASNGFVNIIDTVLFPPALVCPDQLFWVEQRGDSRIGFTGYDCRAKGTTTLATGQTKPVGIAIDSKSESVFWSDDLNAKPFDSWLSKSNFDAAAPVEFIQNMYDPQGMDTDTVAEKLYFTEHQGSKIQMANYDGSDISPVWTGVSGVDYPADVAVDHDAGLVFATVQSVPSKLNGSLHVMGLDGSDHKVLMTGLIQNYGLCVDTHSKHVYYIQGGHGGSISCMKYGTTDCNTKDGSDGIILDGLQYPYMCAVDNLWAPYGGPTRVIFSEPNVPGSVYVVDNDGSELTLIDSDLDAPMGMKLGCRRFFA